MKKTIQKKFFVSEIIASELIALKLSPLKREYLSSTANVLTNSPKIFHITKTEFFQINHFIVINTIIKVLSCRFQQRFGPFTMSLIKGTSETSPFGHWLTTPFTCWKFRNT